MSTKYYRLEFGLGSLAKNFKGSGSVQVHRFEILKVQVRFRFNDLKFKRLRFGSGSLKKSGFYGSRFRFGFGSTPCSLHFEISFYIYSISCTFIPYYKKATEVQ